MNFLDILITSPQYCYKKSMGTRWKNLFFDLRVKEFNSYRGFVKTNNNSSSTCSYRFSTNSSVLLRNLTVFNSCSSSLALTFEHACSFHRLSANSRPFTLNHAISKEFESSTLALVRSCTPNLFDNICWITRWQTSNV